MERVHVANLPPDIRIKDIDDFFRPFGKLVYIDVNHRANPVYAFVQFDSARNAFNAVKARHGYDYEGYTLHLRLVENEVRKRRDATPPPPPPPMFSNYDRQNDSGFNNFGNSNSRIGGNYSTNTPSFLWSTNRSENQQFPASNRPNMPQQNMIEYPNNRSNMQQLNMNPYSSDGRSNMEYSNPNRLSMQQQFPNSNRSSMQQYSNYNNSNISHQNNFPNRPDMPQQNMVSYPTIGRSNTQQQYANASRSNIPQLQNMNVDRPNNSSWSTGNVLGWNTGNFGNDNFNESSYNNDRRNAAYNPNTDPYAQPGFEDSFTLGLSGSGRRWFNRYIRKGFSPQMARNKALEHRTVPYLREPPKNKPIPNDPTNIALETIGNTIMSLLSTTPVDNNQTAFSKDVGGRNVQMPGPSSSMAPQAQLNAVSKRQYFKSLGILKSIREKRIQTARDKISVKYHTQIVKDYEKFRKSELGNQVATTNKAKTVVRPVISTRTEEQISELMRKQKGKLFKEAKLIEKENDGRKRFGGAYKKRARILMNDHGFIELEAKALAWLPLEKLQELLSLKREYEYVSKKTKFIPGSKKSLANTPKILVYRNDMKYLEKCSSTRISGLSRRTILALRDCLTRIHKYEKSENLPLTGNKFTKLLLRIVARDKEVSENKKSLDKSKPNVKKCGGAAVATGKKNEGNKNSKVDEKKSEEKEDEVDEEATEYNQENEDITEENQDDEDITEVNQDDEDIIEVNQDDEDITEEHGGNEEEFQDVENVENEDCNDQTEDKNDEQ